VITKLDRKRNKVTVRFVGYGNEDTVALDELLASKGEEWREGQQIDADRSSLGGEEAPLDLLLPADCQDLLDQLNHSIEHLDVNEELDQLIGTERQKKTHDMQKKSEGGTKNKSEERGTKNKSEEKKQPSRTKTKSVKSGGTLGSWESALPAHPAGPRGDFPTGQNKIPLPPMPFDVRQPPLLPTSQIPLPSLVPPLPPLSSSAPGFLPPPPSLSTEDLDFIHANSEVEIFLIV
jgi:hypothetical protein